MTPDKVRDEAAREYAERYAGISVAVDFKAGWDAALRSVQPKPPFALHETWCSGQHLVDLAGSGECLSDEVLARLCDPLQRKPLTEEHIHLLGQALGDVLVKVGVLRDDISFTGPELLNAATAFVDGCALAATPAPEPCKHVALFMAGRVVWGCGNPDVVHTRSKSAPEGE